MSGSDIVKHQVVCLYTHCVFSKAFLQLQKKQENGAVALKRKEREKNATSKCYQAHNDADSQQCAHLSVYPHRNTRLNSSLVSIVLQIPDLAPVSGTKHLHVTFFSVAESQHRAELNTLSIGEVKRQRAKYISNREK